MEQLLIAVVFCAHIAQHTGEDAHIGHQCLRHLPGIKIQLYIADAVGFLFGEQHLCGAIPDLFQRRYFRLLSDIGNLQHRNGGQCCRIVRRLLVRPQVLRIRRQFLFFFFRKAVFIGGQLLLLRRIHPGSQSPLRPDQHKRRMGIVQEIRLDQLFIVIRIQLLFQIPERIQRFQMHQRHTLIIEPAVICLETIHQSLRVRAEICLPVLEFIIIDPGLQRFPIYAPAGDPGKGLLNDLHKRLFLLRVGLLGDHRENRLVYAVVVGAHDILSDTGIQQRLLQRCAGSPQQHILQHLERQIQLRIQAGANNFIIGKVGVILLLLSLGDGILLLHPLHGSKGLLQCNGGFHRLDSKPAQVFSVHPEQPLLHIHVAIQINIAVGRMIIGAVEIQELFIGKGRDHLRVSAGFIGITGIREKRVQDHPIQNALRRRKSPLHLIVYHAVDRQFSLGILQLIVPALLSENLLMLVNIREENRIHIHVHQIFEICVVAAGNGINRLVRVSHGIQKSIQ